MRQLFVLGALALACSAFRVRPRKRSERGMKASERNVLRKQLDPCADGATCACLSHRDPNFCSTCPNCGPCADFCAGNAPAPPTPGSTPAPPPNTPAPPTPAPTTSAPTPAPPTPPPTPAPTFAPTPYDPENDPNWGCGLLGGVPGISKDGVATPETQRLIDGIKGSSTFNKVNYWNWNMAPDHAKQQYLTKDFIFIPEMWGHEVADVHKIRPAGESNFSLFRTGGPRSSATMSELFMGSNEPDIVGSCMGDKFGTCLLPSCCWGDGVVATGVGFWPFEGCQGEQPLPTMWEDEACIDSVMGAWRQTAGAAKHRGYKYLTTPLVAFNISYAERFIQEACRDCQTIDCGCPQYIGFHFYAYDCQPVALGGYDSFEGRVLEARDVMERYPFIKGVIVNEVGMLNCQSSAQNPICVPDGGRYPASGQPDNSCPQTDELPNGMASFMDGIFDRFINVKTSDGRDVVKAFSWFNLDREGGTYNLQLYKDGKLNELGESYIRNCERWAAARPQPTPAPPPEPTPEPTPFPTFAPTAYDPNDNPNWGCGLLGTLPGISQAGVATQETQRLIDGIKGSSTFNKVNYWNWNLIPDTTKQEHLTKDFIFIPEMWGHEVADVKNIRPAGVANFTLEGSLTSPATMSDLFMGSNEPDITGSCLGVTFGECLQPNCCWGPGVVATGVGFWPFEGCQGDQPLPWMWDDHHCTDSVIGKWKQTASAARHRGYKYLTTPLVAYDIKYAEKFIQHACRDCQTIDCGCPQYIGFHFYAYDCQPVALGGYGGFQHRLDEAKDVMERYPFIKGAIVNEVGMLNCQSSYQNPICVPDSGRYPASEHPEGSCPNTDELPNGMSSFMDAIFDMVINTKTSDGREVVKAFSWFMQDKVGGTYNLQIFTNGRLNDLGESYIRNCQRWEQAQKR